MTRSSREMKKSCQSCRSHLMQMSPRIHSRLSRLILSCPTIRLTSCRSCLRCASRCGKNLNH